MKITKLTCQKKKLFFKEMTVNYVLAMPVSKKNIVTSN